MVTLRFVTFTGLSVNFMIKVPVFGVYKGSLKLGITIPEAVILAIIKAATRTPTAP